MIGGRVGIPAALAPSAALLAPSARRVMVARQRVDTTPTRPAKIAE